MPELPEVETIVRALRSGGLGHEGVLGRVIQKGDLLWERTLAAPNVDEFLFSLPGQRIHAVERRGKFLILQLSDAYLLIHLRMSGDIRVEPAFGPDEKRLAPAAHDRAVFWFEDGMRMTFNDARKFGRMWLVADPASVVGNLGPEPLSDQFSADWLYNSLIRRHRQLKPLLLDQSFIAGLGNIYTDEALFLARLHPLRMSDQVTQDDAKHLWEAIRTVLQEGIRTHGASIDWVYRGGDFQNHFRVYQRTGEPCRVCGTLIERRLVGQRGTHYCPVCQSERKTKPAQVEHQ